VIPGSLNRRAKELGVTLHQGRQELLGELDDGARQFLRAAGHDPAVIKTMRIGPEPAGPCRPDSE